MIDTRYVELKKGNLRLPLRIFTQDYNKDVYILVRAAAEMLDKSIPFDRKGFTIDQYNETNIVVKSRKNVYMLHIDQIYVVDTDMGIEYRFFLYKDK